MDTISKSLKVIVLVCVMNMLSVLGYASTYYIDFQNGNDANPGTVTQPWKTIPGTRNINNTAWQQTSWGGGIINASNKVPPDTVFKFRRGTRHDSSNGGLIWINATYYEDTATFSHPISFELDQQWGIGNIIFDGTGITAGIGLWLIQCNGISLDGKVSQGIIIRNAPVEGLQIKEKPGTGDSVDHCTLSHIKFFNNGTSYSSSLEGTGAGQVQVRKADGLIIQNCELDGNGTHINGLLLGESHMYVINATVCDCISYNHVGNDPPNDAGIGFKAQNSKITYKNCTSHNNLKGWDLGEDHGDNRSITIHLLIAHQIIIHMVLI
ncbi:MAG: hypothetical protein ACMUJM_21750 [bacterium]